jgi:hypothetical protein
MHSDHHHTMALDVRNSAKKKIINRKVAPMFVPGSQADEKRRQKLKIITPILLFSLLSSLKRTDVKEYQLTDLNICVS